MKILLPVDGSKYTKRMLSYIAAHDELLGKGHEYVLFTSVPLLTSRAAEFFNRRTIDEYYKDEAERVLRTPRTFAEKQRSKVRTAHGAGHPAEGIANLARRDGDQVSRSNKLMRMRVIFQAIAIAFLVLIGIASGAINFGG